MRLLHAPPEAGWLKVALELEGRLIEFEASDVPENPMEQLAKAIELASEGQPAMVWWNLEPDGYFMHFLPEGSSIEFRLDHAPNSDEKRSKSVFSFVDKRRRLLDFFWRFLRDFNSHGYPENDWPPLDQSMLESAKRAIARIPEA